MTQEMETFASRLASFDLVLQPDQRRGSSATNSEPIAWPYSRPSPAELAHAGFYYNPYETNPDNTTCFSCQRALDGWEEDDNPITEHLKHSPDCGWAIMMDVQQRTSNPAEIEDPTSDRIVQARLTTFGASWPHDGKRGWVCQSEKMVEGGWYFCPNEESNDLASCPYCKLSLDGWEPKDDPFDEHYRRSADCSFFVFAQPPGKKGKGGRSKKARGSKVSRQSTQSVASEPPSDLDEPMDSSILSQSTTTSKAKGTKKGSKSKAKSAKSKKDDVVETSGQMDVDEPDVEQPEPPKPTRSTRGKKRPSEDAQKEAVDPAVTDTIKEPEERPAKKRATKTRSSSQQAYNQNDAALEEPHQDEVDIQEEESKKSRATSKKGSRSRKASDALATSNSKPEVPSDAQLDGAIEAGLDADKPEPEPVEPEDVPSKPPKKTKSKKKGKTKDATEPVEEVEAPTEEKHESVEATATQVEEPPAQKKSTKKTTSKKGKSKTSNASEPPAQELPEPQTEAQDPAPHDEMEVDRHDSFVSVEIPAPQPDQLSDTETKGKATKRGSQKKTSTGKGKKSKKTEKESLEPAQPQEPIEPQETVQDEKAVDTRETIQDEKPQEEKPAETTTIHTEEQPKHDYSEQVEQEAPQEQKSDPPSSRRSRRSSLAPPKSTERYSDIQQKQMEKSRASQNSNTDRKSADRKSDGNEQSDRKSPEHAPVSPLPASRGSPSLSPQASDAENQPPSMKPSTPHTNKTSPSKHQQSARVPLAASTPSPSKNNINKGGLNTSHPWRPIDVDEILLAGNSDKENVDFQSSLNNIKAELTSPEKKMTVEEWIKWNAKNGEERLRRECERLVGQFEKEGARAMRTLEGIECVD